MISIPALQRIWSRACRGWYRSIENKCETTQAFAVSVKDPSTGYARKLFGQWCKLLRLKGEGLRPHESRQNWSVSPSGVIRLCLLTGAELQYWGDESSLLGQEAESVRCKAMVQLGTEGFWLAYCKVDGEMRDIEK